MKSKKIIYVFMALSALMFLTNSGVSYADNSNGRGRDQREERKEEKENNRPVVVGSVTAVSGNIITIKSTRLNEVNNIYTIDATNAIIMKNYAVGNISSILVGDNVVVRGTLTGNKVVATSINDGLANARIKSDDDLKNLNFTGTGEPIVAGVISTISGNTITIKTQNGVVYTIDATKAKIIQGASTVTISGLAVGDNLVVQGAVNGNSVVASNIVDHKPVASTGTNSNSDTKPNKGFFRGIGSFFSRMFGF